MPKDTAQSKQPKPGDKIIALNETIYPSALCWRSELVSRYESLWSLLHKFAFLNAIKVDVIREVLGVLSNIDGTSGTWTYQNRDDLRFLNGLNQTKLAVILNLREKQVKESAAASFIKGNEIPSLSCETLRYCRRCLEESGFHSALYQLLFLAKCPLHDEEFATVCARCEKKISYRLNSFAFKKPCCCSNCNLDLGLITNKRRELKDFKSLRELRKRDRRLKLIGDWLIQRLEAKTLDRIVPRDSEGKGYKINVFL